MSRKIQSFQNVSAAIDLDSNGFHEAAFIKYIECLQSLSSFLVEQFVANDCSTIDEVQKKEAKQVLSVICDCADRASCILKLEGELKGSPSATKKSVASASTSEACSFKSSFSTFSHSGSMADHFRPLKELQVLPVIQVTAPSRCKSPVFAKMEKENALLFKKYHTRMEYIKDKYARQNLELELQRGLAENLIIAQSKYSELMKQQQEEWKTSLETTMKKLLLADPCLNSEEQEKRELYIEVLRHEAKQAETVNLDYTNSGLTSSEIVEIIFQRTLRCSNHPLMQWLIMVQMKLKNQLTSLLKDFSHYIPLFEDLLSAKYKNSDAICSCLNEIKCKDLHKSVEDIIQTVRNALDSVIAILYAVYKEQISEESEVLAYKLTESLLIIPLWPLIISTVRLTNLESELRITETMQSCRKNMQEIGFSSEVTAEQAEMYRYCVCQLKKIPTLFSLADKLSVFVHVSQKVCENRIKEDSPSNQGKLLGADELVPVLSHILIQSGMPELASECRTLELLIHPKYMLGEEGYSLTSFQTALNYLEMKKLIDPFDSSEVLGETDASVIKNSTAEVKLSRNENS